MNELPEVLTVKEVAKFLRLKKSTAYEMVRQGVIPSTKFGRQIRILKTRLFASLEENVAGRAK